MKYATGESPELGDHISPDGDVPGVPPRMALQVLSIDDKGLRVCPVFRPKDALRGVFESSVFSFYKRGKLGHLDHDGDGSFVPWRG